MSCPICQHPQRRAIDQALIAGSTTLAALSQEHGLSPAALRHHQAHLQANVNRAQAQLQENLRQGCLFYLTQALDMAMQTAVAAQAESNHKLVLQALQQGTRLISIILKQDITLDQEAVLQILTAPGAADQTSLLPGDAGMLAARRRDLAGALFAPCPDTAPAPPAPDPPEARDILTQNLQCRAQQAAQPQTASRKLKTGHHLPKTKGKGGKLPGGNHCRQDNNQAYNDVRLYEAILGLDPLPPSRLAQLGTPNSKLETSFDTWGGLDKIPADKPLSEYIYEQSLKNNQGEKNTG